jgi:hypothetical protein
LVTAHCPKTQTVGKSTQPTDTNDAPPEKLKSHP